MKRKSLYLILCSLLLLPLVEIPISAEEVPVQQQESITFGYGDTSELSSYFWDNYILLPYIESTGTQYINTGLYSSNLLDFDIYVSGLNPLQSVFKSILGGRETNENYEISYFISAELNDRYIFQYLNGNYQNNYVQSVYDILHISLNSTTLSFNGITSNVNRSTSFEGNNIYVFATKNQSNTASNFADMRLYYLKFYDRSLDQNNEEIGVVRSYYPAKSKSGSVVGLYDAVNDVFYPSSGSDPFSLPNGSNTELSITTRIFYFIQGSISWIGAILNWVKSQTLIIVFIVIGLAGAMFRWARKLVHF